jgi:hypothetical protein
MRASHLALIAAVLATPSAGYAQDQGLVGGKVGPSLDSSSPSQPGASAQPYGSPPRAPQERPGFSGSVAPGQVVSKSAPVIVRPGGLGTSFVDGHRVLVDPNSNRILRVFN